MVVHNGRPGLRGNGRRNAHRNHRQFFLSNDSQKRQFYKGYGISDAIVAITINVIALLTVRWSSIPVNAFSAVGYILWLILSFTGIRMFAAKK